jgi:hypothetical protein
LALLSTLIIFCGQLLAGMAADFRIESPDEVLPWDCDGETPNF